MAARRHGVLLSLAALCALFLLGCDAIPDEREEPFAYDFGEPIRYEKGRHAIVFFVDGVNHRTFNRLMDEGRLPNIKRYFVDRGVTVEHAVTCVPSVTYSVMTAFLTGLGPGHNGVPALEWVDRNDRTYRWYTGIEEKYTVNDDAAAPTLFEVLDDQFTVSILNQLTRGVTQYIENWHTVGPAYFFRLTGLMDRLSIIRFEEVNRLARVRRQYPRYVITHLAGGDALGHWEGSTGEAYIDNIVHADAQIGRLLANMENEGVLENMIIVLVSDHGHSPTDRKRPVRFVDTLRRLTGAPVTGRIDTFQKSAFQRAELFEPWEMIVSHSGDRQAFLYVRDLNEDGSPRPWRDRPPFERLVNYPTPDGAEVDLPQALSHMDGVDIVAARLRPGAVLVYGREGIGRIDRRGERGSYRYAWRTIAGDDPLHYDAHEPARGVIDGEYHDDLAWLRATYRSDYPDAVVGIADLFDGARTGDVILFAEPGRQFGNRDFSGHGGLNPADMHVPMLIAGPGIRHGTLETARTVDLFPTVLELLGYADRLQALPPRDGRSLARELRGLPH